MNKIKKICVLIILKIKYKKNIKIPKEPFHLSLGLRNIILKKGKIVFKGKCSMGINSRFGVNNGNIIIGNNCSFNTNVLCISMGNITIGNNVIVGPNVCIYDHDHKFNEHGVTNEYNIGSISIGNNVWIGAGAIILKNTIIEDNCIIGAGTIVQGHIPSFSIVTSDRKNIIKKLEKRSKK